jgi:hypothetical protein
MNAHEKSQKPNGCDNIPGSIIASEGDAVNKIVQNDSKYK